MYVDALCKFELANILASYQFHGSMPGPFTFEDASRNNHRTFTLSPQLAHQPFYPSFVFLPQEIHSVHLYQWRST